MYDYKFVNVTDEKDVQCLLDDGWEPVPDVHHIFIPQSFTTSKGYVFLRRDGNYRLTARGGAPSQP